MPPTRDFPYEDGDVTVLGPEIFASKDGSVISWRGDNYVRHQDVQPTSDGLTADAVHELASAVRDLASAVRLETADLTSNVTVSLGGQPLTDEAKEVIRSALRRGRRPRGGA